MSLRKMIPTSDMILDLIADSGFEHCPKKEHLQTVWPREWYGMKSLQVMKPSKFNYRQIKKRAINELGLPASPNNNITPTDEMIVALIKTSRVTRQTDP